jgi:N,N'-diacetyllegionaminate synthase
MMQDRALIIAEAGVNFNGDLALAFELIDVAADMGADLVKFQTFKAESLVSQHAKKAAYQERQTGSDETQLEMLRRLELSPADHSKLVAHCQNRGIEFFSTGFDIESLDLLLDLGLQRFKVPSGEITNLPYLRHIGRFGLPVILSTGMAKLGEVEAAIDVLEDAGVSREDMTVLHCTTEYPAPFDEVNLNILATLRQSFGVQVGYSDHTQGIEVAIAAVALGARVIEKHFTLDRNLPGPDHAASLEPDELRQMVSSIRNIEMALGSGVKKPTKSERLNAEVARKSIVAARRISKGDIFTEENLSVKRPGTGMSPMRWDELINQTANRDYDVDELIEP